MSFKSLFLSACLTAYACLALAIGVPAAAQDTGATEVMPADAAPGPALWRIADDDTVIYLFGTVHILPDAVHWFDQRIEQAFKASDEVVFEIPVNDEVDAHAQQLILAKALLAGNANLRDLMSPQDRAEFERALAAFGMPAASLDPYEPWMAAMTLSSLPLTSAGYSQQSGVEMALEAQAAGKKKAALETIEQQIDMFDTLPMAMQLTYLDDTVEALPDTAASVSQMIADWLAGDAVSLAAMLNEEMDDPEIYRRLLTDRNARWAQWIDQRMATPGTVFIAVGAGHLAGAGSVQTQLAARGFEVDRIWK